MKAVKTKHGKRQRVEAAPLDQKVEVVPDWMKFQVQIPYVTAENPLGVSRHYRTEMVCYSAHYKHWEQYFSPSGGVDWVEMEEAMWVKICVVLRQHMHKGPVSIVLSYFQRRVQGYASNYEWVQRLM